jgi:hypothetical protein
MRPRAIILLIIVVLVIVAPAVVADLFETTVTVLRDGLRNAIGGS